MENKNIIDLSIVIKTLWKKRKSFFILWPIVFALSCLWIFPQPRYHKCNVTLAPEAAGESVAGGLSALASNFGFNLGMGGNDALYPLLYPDLMNSNEFVVGLFGIRVKTDDGTVDTDYYTYLTKHQKRNWLTYPFKKFKREIVRMLSTKKPSGPSKDRKIDPFKLSDYDYDLVEGVKGKIKCTVDKKTDVISIEVTDQDRLVCAILADSVRQHLQDYIINYRTSKARLDLNHYQHLADSSKVEYLKSSAAFSSFCDANKNMNLQRLLSERDRLESDMQMKYNTYTAMCTQLEAMKVKVQERTPAFTTLQSASVPVKPAGPKRVIFVLAMLVLSSIVNAVYILYKNKVIG